MEKKNPSVVFTLSHIDGKERSESELQQRKLHLMEIHFKATGIKALQILAKSITMAKQLSALDMHVSYDHGALNFKIWTRMGYGKVFNCAEDIGKAVISEAEVKYSTKNLSGWFRQKSEINKTYTVSPNLNRFVNKLSTGIYISKDYNLV